VSRRRHIKFEQHLEETTEQHYRAGCNSAAISILWHAEEIVKNTENSSSLANQQGRNQAWAWAWGGGLKPPN